VFPHRHLEVGEVADVRIEDGEPAHSRHVRLVAPVRVDSHDGFCDVDGVEVKLVEADVHRPAGSGWANPHRYRVVVFGFDVEQVDFGDTDQRQCRQVRVVALAERGGADKAALADMYAGRAGAQPDSGHDRAGRDCRRPEHDVEVGVTIVHMNVREVAVIGGYRVDGAGRKHGNPGAFDG